MKKQFQTIPLEDLDESLLAYDNTEAELNRHVSKIIVCKLMETCKNSFIKSRDLDIIKMRFGIAPYVGVNDLETVARKFELTRERVRAIENKILEAFKGYFTNKYNL